MTQLTAESATQVGDIKYMLTNGRNHNLFDWSVMTAKEIFNISELSSEKRDEARRIQGKIAMVLFEVFAEALKDEKRYLRSYEDQCLRSYDIEMHVLNALAEIDKIEKHSWSDVVSSKEWFHAAMQTIGNMMATLVHIERLWFADDHPENVSAQQYKMKFHGV